MNATLKAELLQRGYTLNKITLDRVYKQFFSPGGKAILNVGLYHDYPFITQTAKKVSIDKTLGYDFAKIHQVNTPATLQTLDMAQASAFLDKYKKVIVKPVDLSDTKGLTINITDSDALKAAIEKATYDTQAPLIQEQFIGDEVRITVLAGKVFSAVHRRTPRVTGDGVSSIRQLIDKENKERALLSFPLYTYPQWDGTMIPAELFNSETVLEKGQTMVLSRKVPFGRGTSFHGITEEVHSSYFDIAEKLANNLNPPMLVIDFMIKDYTAPASSDNYVFLEFNTSPSLEIYSSIRDGDRPDVISKIADLIEKYAQLSD